jgi:O-acetylserine/cysteine efflux transporter
MQTQVFFTAVIGWAVMREQLSRQQQIGLVLAVLAIVCFGMHFTDVAPTALASVTVLGFLLCLCGASLWAASNIVARKAQGANPDFSALGFVVWTSIIPIVPFVLLSYVFDAPSSRGNWFSASLVSIGAAAFLGLLGSSLAYTLWTQLLKRHSANRVAPFSLGVPVVGLAAGMWLLGEQVSRWQWAGIVFVIAALAFSFLPRSKQP